MARNIKLVLEYDGTNYHGWQSQQGSGMPTIQDALEEALRKLTKEDIRTVSSGRTDAGVHARGHVANFLTDLISTPGSAPKENSTSISSSRGGLLLRSAETTHGTWTGS
ncbi:MAG: tRNA pseudouridine synthase [Nitrospirae bacterium]|nr:tRNA pseudouridine synthase [Nitrospirota bacterium]